MRRIAILACGVLLVGCSADNGTGPAPETIVEVITEQAAPANKHAELIDAYSKVLDNPGAYEFNKSAEFSPTGTYDYAIVEVTGDDSPELLLMPGSINHISPITVFSKPQGGELFNTKSVLVAGAASAGGYRAGVMASKTSTGLYQGQWQSVGTSVDSEKFEIKDRNLVSTGLKETLPNPGMYDAEHLEITWTKSTDRGPLQQLGGAAPASAPAAAGTAATIDKCGVVDGKTVFTGSAGTSCQFAVSVANAAKGKNGSYSVQASSPVTGQSYTMSCTGNDAETVCTGGNNASVVLRPAQPGDEKVSAYTYAFEGTVSIKGPLEVSANGSIPNGEGPGSEYIILTLDAPQQITAKKAGPTGIDTKTAASIGLGKKEIMQYGSSDSSGPWRQYVGKRIRLHINTDSMYYQTDASLPMGVPRVSPKNANYQVEVLN